MKTMSQLTVLSAMAVQISELQSTIRTWIDNTKRERDELRDKLADYRQLDDKEIAQLEEIQQSEPLAHSRMFPALFTVIRNLRAKLEVAEKDGKRLDWLSKSTERSISLIAKAWPDSLREAIDATMNAEASREEAEKKQV